MSTPTLSEGGTSLPLRPALKGNEPDEPTSPRSGPVKVVSISAEPENIPTLSSQDEPTRIKQFKAGVADKRMTGRPLMPSNSSSRLSLYSQSSIDDPTPTSEPSGTPKHHEGKHHGHHNHVSQQLFDQVAQWLQSEKAKRAARKSKKRGKGHKETPEVEQSTTRPRASSQSSDSSAISLERLQRILEDNMTSFGLDKLPVNDPTLAPRKSSHHLIRRRSSARKLVPVSSDTEYQDGDVIVPSSDVVLDNSKTMSYTGGVTESSGETVTLSTSKRAEKERKAWLSFKNEILRLAHTLRLKGWRKVPLERGGELEIERLSGALTNAVYVVSPPKDLDLVQPSTDSQPKPHHHRPPPKLLLRVYGPQVEHLIDRENELGILRRLARKKIGPRLLGTFTNGRFEEFFNAQTLTAADLRVEETSKQIAKRMRELHDGMELLEREREEGPFVWRNWDKWVDRCEEVISYLDKEVLSGKKGRKELWRKRGLICGVEWPQFKATIDKYRKWLDEYYGREGVNRKLVFAHNDTQYGNILRLIPEPHTPGSAPSPLLLPQNTHKQLIVIDFEYASANTPGLEFANHFTEWCYNYHDSTKPWACNTDNYPTLEQQTKFVRSYVNHRPQFNPRASSTPKMNAMDGLAKGSISEFLLDSRTPGGSSTDLSGGGYNYAEEEARRERETERQIQELLKEVRIWRVANSAQWVAWGIVQAKVPELDGPAPMVDGAEISEEPATISGKENFNTESEVNGIQSGVEKRPEGLRAQALLSGDSPKEAEAVEEDGDEFDYLAYAQDRALFFWGDVVGLGIVKKEELPESLVKRLKSVDH